MLDKLTPMVDIHHFEEREVIFREGEKGIRFYLLKRGKIVLEKRISDKLSFSAGSVKPGYSFGWSAMLEEGNYTLDAIATEPCEVYSIKGEKINKLLNDDHTMGYIMNQGLLVPDEIVEEVVRKRLEEHDWNYGLVLDGFPRTESQALYLFENWSLDKAIYLDVPEDVIYARVMHRAKAGERDGSGTRADDNPEALKVRLREYQEKTAPLLALFEKKNMLVRVAATSSIEEVYKAMLAALGLAKAPQPGGAGMKG